MTVPRRGRVSLWDSAHDWRTDGYRSALAAQAKIRTHRRCRTRL